MMDTDELIRSRLAARRPAVDVDAAWSAVSQRRARARTARTIGLAAASIAVVAGGVAVIGSLGDDESRLDATDTPPSSPVPAAPEDGDTATWTTDPDRPPSPAATTVAVLVTRLGCSDGETGRVLRPGVVLGTDEVVVTFTVAALGPGAHSCPGNDQVAYEVDLGQPLGERRLVDGSCRPPDGGAADTTFCIDGEVRWDPGATPRTVSGTLTLVGGMAGTEPTGIPGEIEVQTTQGEPIATATAADDGAFHVVVPPGRYWIVGRSPQYQAGDATCSAEVAVEDADVPDVVVACQMK